MIGGSLLRHAGVALVLYAVLAAIAVIAIDLRILLVPAACVSLGLIAAGFVVFRSLRVQLRLPWPAQTDSAGESGIIVVNGEACPVLGYEQELLVEVRIRRWTELLACSLIAGCTLNVIISDRGAVASGRQIGTFEAEAICLGGAMILATCLRWFTERKFLCTARLTFGSILGADPGFIRSGVTYQFFDQDGERRGGKGPLPKHAHDNVVLVMYLPDDPDANAIHGAFVFHEFNIGLLPGRRKIVAEAGVRN